MQSWPKPIKRRATRAAHGPATFLVARVEEPDVPSNFNKISNRTRLWTITAFLRHEVKFKVRTKHGSAEVIRRLYAHQLSIIWRKTLTTIQGKPQHNRAILPVSRLSNREHYVETIVTGMSLGWDLGIRTRRMYLLLRRLVARRRTVAVDSTLICVTFLPRTGTAPCRSDCLATVHAPFHRRMKLPSPLAHTAQSLPVTMLPTKNSLKSFKSVLARSDWPPVLFGSTCPHVRVRHPCPAQHHWRGRPLQRLHLQSQRRQQLGQVSEREQPLGRHWAARTTPKVSLLLTICEKVNLLQETSHTARITPGDSHVWTQSVFK